MERSPSVEGREPQLLEGLGGGRQRRRDQQREEDGQGERGADAPGWFGFGVRCVLVSRLEWRARGAYLHSFIRPFHLLPKGRAEHDGNEVEVRDAQQEPGHKARRDGPARLGGRDDGVVGVEPPAAPRRERGGVGDQGGGGDAAPQAGLEGHEGRVLGGPGGGGLLAGLPAEW